MYISYHLFGEQMKHMSIAVWQGWAILSDEQNKLLVGGWAVDPRAVNIHSATSQFDSTLEDDGIFMKKENQKVYKLCFLITCSSSFMSGVRWLGDFVGQSTPRSKQFGTHPASANSAPSHRNPETDVIKSQSIIGEKLPSAGNFRISSSRTRWVDSFSMFFLFPEVGYVSFLGV